jgi:predicted lipoprotein
MKLRTIIACGLGFSVALICCREPEPEPQQDTFDRTALLTNYADNIIIPRYANFQNEVNGLSEASTAFSADPSEPNLAAVKSAWKASVLTWQRCAMFEFGPASDVLLQSNMNVYPVDTQQVEENVMSGNYDFTSVVNLAAKGLPTLDYLLYKETPALTVEAFTIGDNAQQRLEYLADVVALMQNHIDEVSLAWENGYRDDFVASTGTSVGSSLGLLLNAMNQSFEGVTRMQKLGLPSGAATFSMTPLSDHVEAYFEEQSNVSFIQSSVVAFEDLYHGNTEDGQPDIGIGDYLNELQATHNNSLLHGVIQTQIDDVINAVNELDDPLAEFVVSDQQTAIDAYGEMQQLVVLWKVDMMSALGVLITYQDNDGD